MTLRDHAAPIRRLWLKEVDTEAVLTVLRPIWLTVPARPLARAVSHLLPRRQKLTRGHHRALPFDQVPAFMATLRGRDDLCSHLLEFVVLTAARSGEARGARWSEVDRAGRVWTVPRERMKVGKEHRVPLSDRASEILDALESLRTSEFIFPNLAGRPFSDMSMTQLLRRMGFAISSGLDAGHPRGLNGMHLSSQGARASTPREPPPFRVTRFYARTTSASAVNTSRSVSATLPRKARATPFRPCVPKITRSGFDSAITRCSTPTARPLLTISCGPP